jgi:hypothetical protein
MGVTVSGETETSLLNKAVTAQINKVYSIGSSADVTAAGFDGGNFSGGWPVTFASRSAFVTSVVNGYPAAGSADAKLNYALKQAWYANFGNGFEVYNAFRRTGYPNDIQAPLQLPRQFALRLPYAQDELNLNSNTPTVVYDSPSDAIFWDVLQFQF